MIDYKPKEKKFSKAINFDNAMVFVKSVVIIIAMVALYTAVGLLEK